MENKKGSKTKKDKGSKITLIIVSVFALILFIQGAVLQPEIIKNKDIISELMQQKEYEEKRKDEVDKMKANVKSDEYVEKIARDKLGMIKKDEIVFVDVNEKDKE